jgi:hypothetical protein
MQIQRCVPLSGALIPAETSIGEARAVTIPTTEIELKAVVAHRDSALEQVKPGHHWKLLAARSTLRASLKSSAWLLGRWFTTYRRLFLLVLGANLLFLYANDLRWIDWRPDPAVIATANIFLAVLLRNEIFVRAVHIVLVGLCNPAVVPLAARLRLTDGLLHMGGLHSGLAASGTVWLAAGLYWSTAPSAAAPLLRGLGSLLLGLLLVMCVLAIKPVRESRHNLFEYSHRYLGWAGIAVLWCFVLVSGAEVALWLTVGITVLVALPWLTVRRVRVKTYSPSEGVIAIKFRGGLGVGAFGRISRTLLGDWHTFALVSRTRQDKSHLMVVSAVGDFTRGLVMRPPLRLYVRSVKFLGLPYSLQAYRRAVIVATGAGIAPFLPLLTQAANHNYHVIWIGRSFHETFGRRLSERVLRWPHLTIWDTARTGRPDALQLVARAYRDFNAEVVFIGCNPEATRQLVYGCSALGIAAFGPSWDS